MRFLSASLAILLLAACASPLIPLTADQQAFAATQARAEAGDVAAERDLGLMYKTGKGTPSDISEALSWLGKAADGGDAVAESEMGVAYGEGVFFPQDPQRAFQMEMKAAQQRLPAAESLLGSYYLRGVGTTVDYVQAIVWLKKASDEGDPIAPGILGYMCARGLGVPENGTAAMVWTQLSADRGSIASLLYLANMYRTGSPGMWPDSGSAAKYFAKAAAGVVHSPGELRDAMIETVDAHKVYPKDAVTAKQQGLVMVEFDTAGPKASHIRVTRSSGSKLLDDAAVQAVSDSTFPRRDPFLDSVKHFQIGVNFMLGSAGAAPPQ